jgi:hypothetical protein
MDDEAKRYILGEQMMSELQTINEYVREIPKMNERLGGVERRLGDVESRLGGIEADVAEIKGLLITQMEDVTELKLASHTH